MSWCGRSIGKMESKSHKILKKIKNINYLEKRFLMDCGKKIKITEIKILKDKWIFENDFKITILIKTKNKSSNIILEIHDNKYYYKKNLFVLKNIALQKNNVLIGKLFGFNNTFGLIYRNLLPGEPMIYKLKKIKEKDIKNIICWLSVLHKYNYKNIKNKKFLTDDLNTKIEKEIFKKVNIFIKPNIEIYKEKILNNLNILLKNFFLMNKKKYACLTHGDFQPANFYSDKKNIYISDFDTLQIGNPARDLGRLIFQIENFSNKKKISNFITKEYFKIMNFDKQTKNKIKKDIKFYQAEMIAYVILDRIWGEKIPNKKEIKKLINLQNKYLQIYKNKL